MHKDSKTIATVGTFDGVHRGHLAVVDTIVGIGKTRGLAPLVFTFDRHPLEVVRPSKAPRMLMLPRRRDGLLRRRGVEVVELPFNESLASLTAGEWMRRLASEYGVRGMVIGYDNTFGCDGISLSIDDFRRLGDSCGIEVDVAPVVEGVSSSTVRGCVAEGDIARAMELLGRPYELTGIVVHGNALGTGFGFPTANLAPDPRLAIPGIGVYVADALLPDGSVAPAMVNIGTRPTLAPGQCLSVEAHILGFSGSLYSLPLTLRFYQRLRNEQKFGSVDDLRDALRKDSEAVSAFFCKNMHFDEKL